MKNKNKILIIIVIGIILLLFVGVFLFQKYKLYIKSNVSQETYLYIKTGSSFNAVIDSLKTNNVLNDWVLFERAASEMKYLSRVKPGRYHLKTGMGNRQIVNMLLSGSQEPVKLSFHNIRLKKDFTNFVGSKLELDSVRLLALLDSSKYLQLYGFTPNNVYVMFLPNSYEFYWNISLDAFFKKMNQEYDKFWNKVRKAKAKDIGLTPIEVSILASIVDAEALKDGEMPMIAGLYMNRLKKRMKLESDPTVIYANCDFSIHRVLNRHLRVVSPYNTYQNVGLPPGPIMMPSVKAIDAVLNYTSHPYIYMCAKEDFSGVHNFAQTEIEHKINARKFQQALNRLNIKR